MANSLLKWCKTKILSGYKQINVEGNDEMCSGNRSDTEFLVRSSDEEILLTTPAGRRSYACGTGDVEAAEISYSVTSSPKFPFERRKRMVEWRGDQGVSCDLSLSEDICERQEFAFTLYDFHGQGRVTKDDIASLVQSIYETVGSSMSLPPSGSRTVKVKLSVAPNEVTGCQKYDNRGQRISNWSCSGTPKESPRTLFNDSSSSLGESPRYYEDWNNSSYRTSPNVTPRTKDSPRVGDSITSPRQGGEYVEPLSPTLECNHSPRQLIEAEEETEGVTPRKTKRRRKVHYQRQELLQMIQANMEKNNLYYPPVKNHSCVHSHQNSHHRRRRKRSFHHQHNTYHGCCCKCPCGVSTQQQQQKCHGSNGSLDPATLKARLMHYDNSTTSVSANVDSGAAASCDRHAASLHHHRSRSQDLDTNSPHVFRHHLLDASSSQHQHPLPPSNTPDRPTSPHINHHQHQHSHSHHHHIMSGYRHRSRSCDGEEKVKERLGLSYPVPPTTGVYHHNHLAKKKKNNLESVMRHHNPFADDEAPTWLGKKTSLKDAEIGLIRDLAISLPSKSDENGNSNSSSSSNNNNNNNSSDSFKEYDVNDLIVATKNIRVDDGASGSGNNGCGRSQHVHQHYHHHYHHYPSTPLII